VVAKDLESCLGQCWAFSKEVASFLSVNAAGPTGWVWEVFRVRKRVMVSVETMSTYPSKEFSKMLSAVSHEFFRFLSVRLWKEDFSLSGLWQLFPLVGPFAMYKMLNSVLDLRL
jgi:hypothetical protein